MNINHTHLFLILDKSSSMSSLREATIEGFNSFIKKQSDLPGEMTVSLVQFADNYETSYLNVPIKVAPILSYKTYNPDGVSTALLGAIGKSIDDLGKYLAGLPENSRPGKVVVAVFTDGFENSTPSYEWSNRYTREVVASKIKTQKDVYSWDILFVGSNQDAILTGSQYNVSAGKAFTYSNTYVGVTGAYSQVSDYILRSRSAKTSAEFAANTFTEAERKIQEDLINKAGQ